MNKLLNFIYYKKDEGVYRIYRILGIKIITKPFKLKIQNQLNSSFNEIILYNQNLSKDLYYLYDMNNNKMDILIYAPLISKCINYNKLNYKLSIKNFFNSIVMYSHIESKNSDSYCLQFLFSKFLWFNNFYPKLNILIIHGLGIWYENVRSIEIAIENNIPLFIEEDGFILEYMLNDKKLKLDDKQIERAKLLIDKIITNKISKYNHQPIYKPEIGKHKTKILVIDQSYGDMSISYGYFNH